MKKLKGKYDGRNEKEWSTSGLHQKILDLIPKVEEGTAVDLACGSGNLANGLTEKGYNVLGVDIKNFLTNKNINFKKMDLDSDWKIKSESAELITATEIIEHLENPRHFIREIKRILKDKGIVIISTPNIFNWKARIYYPIKGIIWGFREEDYKISGHITPITKYDFQRICSEERMNIKKITYNNSEKELFGDNLIVIIKKGL